MDVTDEQRAVLTRELDRVLGTEATSIMMAHLPPGGADRLATKQDIAELRTELRAEISLCATKEDLKRFATKEDLKRFATKEDLKAFATKDDLKAFATKEDLSRFHTREEHAAFRTEVNQRFAANENLLRQLLERILSLDGKVEAMGHQLRSELRAELNASITGQTRAVILSLIGIMTVLSGFMFALIQTAQP